MDTLLLKTYNFFNDLPPAVENIAIKKSWLSPLNTKFVEKIDGS